MRIGKHRQQRPRGSGTLQQLRPVRVLPPEVAYTPDRVTKALDVIEQVVCVAREGVPLLGESNAQTRNAAQVGIIRALGGISLVVRARTGLRV